MRDLRRRIGGSDRVMILAPHPDDESLATAGVLQWTVRCGGQARVVFLTDGENNPWAQRATERRWAISTEDRRRWGARRRREAVAALACLGLPATAARFLGLPDQHVTERVLRDVNAIVTQLGGEIDTWHPTQLFLPSQTDRHPDHGITAVLVAMLLKQRSSRPNLFQFRIHPPVRRNAAPLTSWMVLTTGERASKREAVLCHRSQLALGRRGLLEFVDLPERFEEIDPREAMRDGPLPLRALASSSRTLSFAIRMSPRVLLGDAALLLLIPDGDGFATLPVKLGDRGTQTLRFSAEHEAVVSIARRGADLIVTVAASSLEFVSSVFAKLDLRRERRLGLFDPWPWQRFARASAAHPLRVTLAPKNVTAISAPVSR